VLGRNCRFLQGYATERERVGQISHALRRGVECSVRITNYTKQGEPYAAVLRVRTVADSDGVARFALGVQYNGDGSGSTESEEVGPAIDSPCQKINRSHAHAHNSRTHDSRTNHSHEHRAGNGATTLNSRNVEEKQGHTQQEQHHTTHDTTTYAAVLRVRTVADSDGVARFALGVQHNGDGSGSTEGEEVRI